MYFWSVVDIIFIPILSLHFFMYRFYSNHREFGYLKSNIIGIDIDGVLNRHRDHFCELVEEKTGRKIYPDQITHIPVHEIGLTTLEEDNDVFNEPRYWIHMPIAYDSSPNMRKLRTTFKLKVLIFTHRAWPKITVTSKVYSQR